MTLRQLLNKLDLPMRIIHKLTPARFFTTVECARVLWEGYGHHSSAVDWNSLDGKGKPMPWVTYPAWEYPRNLDLREKRVFEYGSGNSTLFYAPRAGRLECVEHDTGWFEKVKERLPDKVMISLKTDRVEYTKAVARNAPHDLITIDGEFRPECAREAVKCLSEQGMILLDNSDWYPNTAAFLRACGLIEVDFTGFGPLVGYVTTTSVFLKPGFNFQPLSGRQPEPGVGSVIQVND
jgi:hypothetical protein